MSTLLISYKTFCVTAQRLTFLQEQNSETMKPILDSFKSIRTFLNDAIHANLRSYRVAYNHLIRHRKISRQRLRKLPATRKIIPCSMSNRELRSLIKDLQMIEYNIDYDCKAKKAMQQVIYNVTDILINNHEMQEPKPFMDLRETLTMFDFRMFYDSLHALKFNPKAHAACQIKNWNSDGPVVSSNTNNKMFEGLSRMVGGLRASYLRYINSPTQEKFTPQHTDAFKTQPTMDIIAYALMVTSQIRRNSKGKAKELAERLQNSLADDLIRADC